MFALAAKLFSVLLALIVISKSYVELRSRSESLQIFLFWLVTWTAIVIVALFPSILDVLIELFGGGRTGLGTFFGMGLVFLFFLVYRIYVKLARIEQKLIQTVREIAMREDWKGKQTQNSTTKP